MKKLLLSILALSVTSFISAQLVENGLILHYQMGSAGYSDDSGNGNNSLGTSGVSTDTDRFGNASGATYFAWSTGGHSYVQLPDSILIPQDRSISLWFKTNLNQGAIMLGMQNTDLTSTPGQYVPVMFVGVDSLAHGQFWSGSTSVTGSVNFKNESEWHHLVLTSDASGQKMYIDDSLQGTAPAKVVLNAMKYGYIGTGYATNNWPAISSPGYHDFGDSFVDDVRIYDRAITATEVDSLFHENGYGWVGINENRTSMTSIFPNPVSDVLNIQTDEMINSVCVFSLSGQLLFKSNDRQVNVEDLVNGIYLITITTENGVAAHRFVKE